MSLTKVQPVANQDFQFRPIADQDKEFLQRLYGSTRASELAMLPWTEKEKEDFISMQFQAQHTFYQDQFKQAEFNIVCKDNADIGRLYTDVRSDEIRIIDIALLPNYRRMGLGKKLLDGVITKAKQLDLPITIHVEKNNPAMNLYKRLGFEVIEDQGVYDLMRWQFTD